jgi:gamma-glutamylaminecyclotransferase
MFPLFVFGTLKEGFPNFGVNKGVRLPGGFLTKFRYPLYLVGERYSPWLVLSEGEGFRIRGQVFRVDEKARIEMDTLERIDAVDGYRRVQIPVISESSNEEILVSVYGKPVDQLEGIWVRLGPIPEYKIEHSLLYRKRALEK